MPAIKKFEREPITKPTPSALLYGIGIKESGQVDGIPPAGFGGM